MKVLISFSAIAILLVVLSNCSPKTSKSVSTSSTSTSSTSSESSTSTSSTTSSGVYKPSASEVLTDAKVESLKAEYAEMTPDQLEKGKLVYESSCKKCHKLHSPNSYDAAEWMGIMRKMGPKAKLGEDHYRMVSAYLVKGAK